MAVSGYRVGYYPSWAVHGCMVAWLSWGGWRLKRAVTLSPLETAALFVNLEMEDQSANSLREVLRPGATIGQIFDRREAYGCPCCRR